ncbi:hypothetical protein HDU92_008507, partial [Lobulomyces angularis]
MQRLNKVLIKKQTLNRQLSSTSVFAPSFLKTFLPQVNFKGETTLGEIFDSAYTNYKYKMAYPIILWGVFLYANLWQDYRPEADKAVERQRQQYLKKMEFHQD